MTDKQTAIVPLDIEPPVKPEPKPAELIQVEARTISKFAEASMIEYSDEEKRILFAPIDVKDVKVRPDSQIYLEWAWYAERLDQAFGQGQWSLSPAPWNPRLFREGNITYREYVLWIRGQFVGNAVGHHEEQRRTANFGDAAESTYANALVRCCKRIGMARDLWKKDEIEKIKKHLKSVPTVGDKVAGGALSSKTNVSAPATSPSCDPAPAPLDYYLHCKDQLANAGSIEELYVLWKFAAKHRDKMTSAQFVELEVLKNQRKEEFKVEV